MELVVKQLLQVQPESAAPSRPLSSAIVKTTYQSGAHSGAPPGCYWFEAPMNENSLPRIMRESGCKNRLYSIGP